MSTPPRMSSQFRFGKRKPKPKPRALVTQDGTTIARDEARPVIVYGESFRIAGEPIAMDARPKAPAPLVTFDGAMPSTSRKDPR